MSTKRVSSIEVIIWLFVFLLLILVISPIGLGFKVKDDYVFLTQKMSSMLQTDVSIVKYDRGYFSSDAVLQVQLPGTPVTLQFKEKIIHGPVYLGLINQGKSPFVAAVVNGELLPAVGYEAVLSEAFSAQSALIYQSLIDFVGNVDTQAYVPSANLLIDQDERSFSFKSSPMFLSSHYSVADEKISGENKLASFMLTTAHEKLNLNKLSLSFSGYVGDNELLMGDSVLSFDKLDVQSNSDQFALKNFSISSVSSEAGGLVNSQMRINVQEILLSNQQLGPIVFALNLNGLNAVSIKQLANIQKTMNAKMQQGIPVEQLNTMLVGQMLTIIPELFKQSVISIDPLSVQSELGKLEVKVDFSVDGLDQATPVDPMFLLNAINLEINMDADESLLKQLIEWQLTASESQLTAAGNTQARKVEAGVSMAQKVDENIKGLVDENWLTYADRHYASHISLQQGLMMVNHKQLDPMAQIISQMGSAPAAVAP